ncbi:MAG: serine/threonine-protein kinase [Candidatus Saganbacteria bacterium]|nr:serine/threonine-protein kinase [Candidatus Saganbacteria bacterium]
MDRFLKSKYKIGEQIGDNPFSVTYKGAILGNDLPLVIKIYKRRVLNSPLIKEIKRKVRDLCALSHPNIAKVFDGDYGWQGFYFVREYIEGKSLAEVLKSGKPMDVDKATDVGLSICEGIRTAHENGMIHGSLIPNNVFIDNGGVVKLTDFVIEGSMRGATKEGAEELFNTGAYLAPERIKGELPSKSTDIYNIGLLLYNMLTLRNPFDGNSEIDKALKLVRRDVPPPSKWNSSIPSYMDEIVLKAMAKDPMLRFDIIELHSSLKAKGLVSTRSDIDIPDISFEASFEEAEKLREGEASKKKIKFRISFWFWIPFIILTLLLVAFLYFKYLVVWE